MTVNSVQWGFSMERLSERLEEGIHRGSVCKHCNSIIGDRHSKDCPLRKRHGAKECSRCGGHGVVAYKEKPWNCSVFHGTWFERECVVCNGTGYADRKSKYMVSERGG